MTKVTFCRMCKSNHLSEFLDLGLHPPSDNFLTEEQLLKPEKTYPLNVLLCDNCGLCQLGFIIPPDLLYNSEYPYETSMNKSGIEHFTNAANSISKKFDLDQNSLVIDIGSNVGVLLSGFLKNGIQVLGIEPSSNIAKKAIENGINTLSEFFSISLANKILNLKGKANVITGTNVFAHIDNLDDYVTAVQILLDQNGVLIIEAPYLQNMIDNIEYDTIYHEHLSYLSLKPMIKFFQSKKMDVFDVEFYSIHGGSLRYFICHQGKKQISSNVRKFLENEINNNLHSIENMQKFSSSVEKQKSELINLLTELQKKGKKIVGLSAPAKGNTLLNYCKIGTNFLEYVTEKSTLKIGKYTPGTRIKIYSDDFLKQDKPDYALILAWNFASDIIKNNTKFAKQGGKFIIPIPFPKII